MVSEIQRKELDVCLQSRLGCFDRSFQACRDIDSVCLIVVLLGVVVLLHNAYPSYVQSLNLFAPCTSV